MPDTSVDTIKTETKPKPKNKKGFREPTSLHVDPKLWQEVRIMAVLKNVSVTEYFEDALRRKLDIDYREVGRQGYQVGQGGMYIPPPPASQSQSQSQPGQPQQQQSIPKGVGNYPEVFDRVTWQGINMLSTKGHSPHVQKMFSILKKVIEAVAKEQRVSKEEAIRLIRDRKDLLQRAAKEVGDSEIGTLRMLLPKFEFK